MKLPKWHWKNQSQEKQQQSLKKMSKGWKNLEKRPYKKRGENRNCLVCNKEFYVKLAHIKNGKGKYCSQQCCGLDKKKIPEHKHSSWKGDGVGYFGVHNWVHKHKGKAKKCIKCGFVGKCQWANVSKQYKRNVNDYISLCPKCHWHYDRD